MQGFSYDFWDHIEFPTFVLSNIYHHHIGEISNIDKDSVNYNFNMSSSQEVSFDVYKVWDGKECELWDKIISFKYVFIPEHGVNGCYYHMEVDIDEDDKTVKHCTLTSAGEFELSNKYIYSLEVNTESDILQDDYVTTVIYDENNPRASLLNRCLADKAPDWGVGHVDATIKNLQRTFSVSNQTIYDFLTKDVAEEINCLFVFDSVTRTISAYDLLNTCNSCGYRGEFLTKCPKCQSTSFTRGYGDDSNIFISYNNYSEKFSVSGEESQVKNCFRVTGGDDYMNEAIMNVNPNGSPYIYSFSDRDYDDMPAALVTKLNEYAALYDQLLPEYKALVNSYYDLVNQYYFYKTSMMPRSTALHWEANKGYSVGDTCYVMTLPSWCYLECVQSGTTGGTEFDATHVTDGQLFNDGSVIWKAVKHIISVPSAKQSHDAIAEYLQTEDVYFLNSIPDAITTVNNTVKTIMALAVNSLFRIEIITDSSNYVSGSTWYGKIKIYNSGNVDDTYTSTTSITAHLVATSSTEDYENYMKQKVEKRLNKKDTTFTEIYEIEDDEEFREVLTQYGLDSLSSFYNSYQGCLDVLIQNGVTSADSRVYGIDLYTPIYEPYYNRMQDIQKEIDIRQAKVDQVQSDMVSAQQSMQTYKDRLNLHDYLGDTLYNILFNYIREGSYNNSNYISEGLSDGEVLSDANTLLELANDELEKAKELQYTLTDTLKNLLNTSEFKEFKDKFKIGDYIVCMVDEQLYQLRLINCSYNFGSPESLGVTFSNATRVDNYFSDAQDILSKAKTMSTSYDMVQHQVVRNTETTSTVNSWEEDGITATDTSFQNNDMSEIYYSENGIVARQFDDGLNAYGDEQIRITHNIISFTQDNWKTASLGIGKMGYKYFDTTSGTFVDGEDFGVQAKFVNAGYIYGTQIVAGDIVSENYSPTNHTGAYIDLNNGYLSFAGGALTFGEQGLVIDPNGGGGSAPPVPVKIQGADIQDSPINVNNNFIVDAQGNCSLEDLIKDSFLECY